jgi:hypothetical protein
LTIVYSAYGDLAEAGIALEIAVEVIVGFEGVHVLRV